MVERDSNTRSDRRTQSLTCEDGRIIGFGEFGADSGVPVIYLHGLPGSRFEAGLWEAEATALNIRLIAPDRPGIGLSTRNPGLKLPDYSKDVARLAAHLGLSQYNILAISGGAPYAIACAMHREDLSGLQRVGVVAGLGPRDVAQKGMSLSQRLSFYAMDWLPSGAVRWLWDTMLGNLARSEDTTALEKALRKSFSSLKPQDVELCEDEAAFRAIVASMRGAFAEGSQGYVDDATIISKPWGFDLAEVRGGPTLLWYGEHDDLAPPGVGKAVAEKIPGAAFQVFAGETHFCTVLKHQKEILTALCSLADSQD